MPSGTPARLKALFSSKTGRGRPDCFCSRIATGAHRGIDECLLDGPLAAFDFGPDASHLKPIEVLSVLQLERCLESADRAGANRDAESAGFHRQMHVTIAKKPI